jgi:hypothetical protein
MPIYTRNQQNIFDVNNTYRMNKTFYNESMFHSLECVLKLLILPDHPLYFYTIKPDDHFFVLSYQLQTQHSCVVYLN